MCHKQTRKKLLNYWLIQHFNLHNFLCKYTNHTKSDMYSNTKYCIETISIL